jgi:hypothetical protein
VAEAAGLRYVRVTLNSDNAPFAIIALLGHELQHALEVAREPEVRSQETLLAFYKRVGITVAGGLKDTSEARKLGRQVRSELALRVNAANAIDNDRIGGTPQG